MNAEEFIENINKVLNKGTIDDVEDVLKNPPGRQPDKNLLNLSKWYNNLHEEDKSNLQKVIQMSVDSTIFGFLCIIDGVRTLEDDVEKGSFELYFKKNEKKTLLNDESADFLHDIYRSI